MTTSDYNIIQSCKHVAYKWCQRKEDAEDIMQDVFMKIWIHYDQFKTLPDSEKKMFTKACIKNRIIDFHRTKTSSSRPKYHDEIKDYGSSNLKTEPDVFARLEWKEMMKKGTKNRHFKYFLMNQSGYLAKEIAAMTQEPIATVLGHCRYARIYLKSVS